jgi:arginase
MKISLIQVPYMLGDDRHGAGRGPARLLEAGAEELLQGPGTEIRVGLVERDKPAPFPDAPSASLAVNRPLARAVGRAVRAGRLPLVLAGSCDAALGVLGGFDHSSCGVVWIDAHADFNTPESSVSGFFPGMTLAILAGHCHAGVWGQIGDNAPVPEESVLLIGVRDLSPAAERERLERSGIQAVAWDGGTPRGDVGGALEALGRRARDVYLHVDLDAFDPSVAPGIVDEPVPGGLSPTEMEEVVRSVAARFRIRAAALTTFTPDRDRGETTLRAALRVIELIGVSGGAREAF